MKIYFNREWTREEIKNLVRENSYSQYEEYEDLKALCISSFAEDEEFYSPDYRELIFVVPAKWLRKIVKEEFYDSADLEFWLKNVYTTDESESIFEEALEQRQIVMVDFD